MVQCSAYGCTKVGVHRFPKLKRSRDIWTKVLKRKDFKPTDYSRLCSDHFLPEDFAPAESVRTGKVEIPVGFFKSMHGVYLTLKKP